MKERELRASSHGMADRVQILFLAILLTTIASAFGLIWVHQFVPEQSMASADLIIEVYRSHISPKPTERFVFILLAAAVPVGALVLAFSPWQSRQPQASAMPHAKTYVLPFVVAALLFAPFAGSDFIATILGEYGNGRAPVVMALAVTTMASAVACFWSVLPRRPRWRTAFMTTRFWISASWLTFLFAVTLQLFAWRLVSFASVTRSGVWSTHADPVFYAISQVVAGKTLMVDLPSQYGFFPEMIAPLFKVIGLSVFKMSVLFAAMQVLSLAALYYVLTHLIKSRLLLVITGLALIMLTFESVLFFAGIDERYYQYWPVRFFWPALSVLGFHYFLRQRTLARSSMMSLLGATGIVWNIDSGLFITVAYGAYLVARLIAVRLTSRQPIGAVVLDRWPARRYLIAIALHVVITAGVVAAFLIALSAKAEQPLNLFWLLEYQKIFYTLGLMMLPLPRQLDPWMSVLGVYLMGLLASLTAWRRNSPRLKDDALFYLSMLGLGLFVYYQGRSHVLNLVSVCWPATLIGAILADDLLRGIRARLIPMGQICLPIAALSILLLASASFAARVPRLLNDVTRQYVTRGVTEEPFVRNELAFIKQHTIGRHECLILSQRQGIYYAESGLASPVKGPGFVEILLKAHEQRLVEEFLNGHLSCVFLGIGGFTSTGIKMPMREVLANYVVAAQNAENTLLYLQAKP